MALLEQTQEKTIQEEIYNDARIQSSDIKVKVVDSTAVLTGSVPTYSEKMAAGEDAFVISGIDTVQNNIQVNFPVGQPTLPDDELKKNIVSTLSWNTRIDSSKIDVFVDAGIVTLNGSVDAYWKKNLVEDLVLGISGVVEITNNLNIVWSKKYEDELIAKDIKDSLRRSTLDSESITIAVTDGLVVLSGDVSDYTEKTAVSRKAASTLGVQGIINQIKVV